ncbi:prepilin-type N-terminal cleavage/methylation domain-containing protein [Patescibacteria group bacterium]|nr:prepilin-type N-terminal cleavage/methylation domain-containing protein [Patescibacteria group bacterium]MBU1890104.1 prepilin-type N-terminal cleavage/methylation domain-containing protein [Patescibacteria group bacterium]
MNTKGITLIETIVAMGIFAIAIAGLYALFNLGTRVLGDNRSRIDATALSNKRMEMIRNLSYDDIGTVSGIPPGTIERTEITTINGIDYTITTDVIYIDDPFDGIAGEVPDDLFNADYKRIRIEVTWENMMNDLPVILITDVSPKGLETALSGGTISFTVFDALGDPVSTADVHIENTDIVPIIDIDTQTTANGKLTLPGAPPSLESYDIIVSKAGYSTDQTYEVDLVDNPNPDPPPLTVFDGVVTEKSFSIDLLSTLTINTYTTESAPLGNIDFALQGSKIIGTDGDEAPIYKYSVAQATDASGQLVLNDMEWDTYDFIIDNIGINYDIAGANLPLPISILPDTSHSVEIFLAPHTDHSILVTVRGETGDLIEDASLHLTSIVPPYDNTQVTSSYGQTFFSDLSNINYDLNVQADGYDEYDMEIMVEDATTLDIFLTEST